MKRKLKVLEQQFMRDLDEKVKSITKKAEKNVEEL